MNSIYALRITKASVNRRRNLTMVYVPGLRAPCGPVQISQRQHDILSALAHQGKDTQNCAQALGIVKGTVTQELGELYTIFNVQPDNLDRLLEKAADCFGWIYPPEDQSVPED